MEIVRAPILKFSEGVAVRHEPSRTPRVSRQIRPQNNIVIGDVPFVVPTVEKRI